VGERFEEMKMSEHTRSGTHDYDAMRRQSSELYRFAVELNRVGDEVAEYSRNLVRANGGDETEQSEWYYSKASILHEVAKAAQKATGL
jgi:hypothetical protein